MEGEFWLDRPDCLWHLRNVKANRWQLQKAKDHFSEVVERAQSEGAQTITKHGKPVVVVVHVDEFNKLTARPKAKKKATLLEVLKKCPAPEIFDYIEEARREPDYGRTVHLD